MLTPRMSGKRSAVRLDALVRKDTMFICFDMSPLLFWTVSILLGVWCVLFGYVLGVKLDSPCEKEKKIE